jgi:hypothetical protein
LTLTGGGFLGDETQLAPGYAVGGTVSSTVTQPPTVTVRIPRLLFGISYTL